MAKKFAVLQRIDNGYEITKKNDSVFWVHLQNSLLLALKEQGRLNEIQYRCAVKKLNDQQCGQEKSYNWDRNDGK